MYDFIVKKNFLERVKTQKRRFKAIVLFPHLQKPATKNNSFCIVVKK